MEKMQAFMERFFVPFAAKINSQRHVAAVRDAFTLSFPLTMAGSMVIINKLCIFRSNRICCKFITFRRFNS